MLSILFIDILSGERLLATPQDSPIRFTIPEMTPATMIFIGVLAALFFFFVFLFFSWHSAVFYIGDEEYTRVSAPFMKEITLPVPEAREGRRFIGWYKDAELHEPYTKETYLVKLFTASFYAKFEGDDTPAKQ